MGSRGDPKGKPRGNGTKSERGGVITSVISLSSEIATVGIPARSISAAIRPTV
ncbi:MAG: hypothetical protein R2684_14650 [Pyrinomonadaceae bacterium]